jgi:hypothetical protein
MQIINLYLHELPDNTRICELNKAVSINRYLSDLEVLDMDYTVSRRPVIVKAQGSIPGESMWDLWWTKWPWDTCCRE